MNPEICETVEIDPVAGRRARSRAEAEWFLTRSAASDYCDPAKGEKNWSVVEGLRDVPTPSGVTVGVRLDAMRGGRALVPCCGLAGVEFVAQDRLGLRVDAFDLDERILRRAAAGRQMDGILQFAGDANEVVLEAERYDLILMIDAAHHVEDLEHFFGQLNRALRPGGLLVGHEYVGENRIGFFPENMKWIHRIWALIPDEYKHRECRPAYVASVPAALSPNEGIRCREIPRVARESFRLFHEKRIHAIDWPIFQRLNLPADGPGADPAKVREGRMIREWIGLLESFAMDSDLLSGHGMTFVAEKRS